MNPKIKKYKIKIVDNEPVKMKDSPDVSFSLDLYENDHLQDKGRWFKLQPYDSSMSSVIYELKFTSGSFIIYVDSQSVLSECEVEYEYESDSGMEADEYREYLYSLLPETLEGVNLADLTDEVYGYIYI